MKVPGLLHHLPGFLLMAAALKLAPHARANTPEKIEKPGTYSFEITQGSQTRRYMIHVPKGYKPEQAAPLVLLMHGGGGSMKIQARDSVYGLISKSNEAGFVAVFPNGYSRFASGKLATWNAGRCCGLSRDRKVDDVGFIRDVLQQVSQQLHIDKGRIFAAGMSNGAMMAYRLACELPETFRAIAAVAGTDNTLDCNPASPVSILHIHARDDDHVLFTGGAGQTFRDKASVTEFTSVPETVEKWVKLNGCESKAQRFLEKSGAFCERYAGCRGETSVQLCVTESGGHSWPGGRKPRMLISDRPSKALSANDVMWDFFQGS
jgi:polyhydroxybutyrate depolymerase